MEDQHGELWQLQWMIIIVRRFEVIIHKIQLQPFLASALQSAGRLLYAEEKEKERRGHAEA